MISSLLSDREWQTLRADVRSGRQTVRLECGTPAYLRTSRLGVRHFVHQYASGCLDHQKETGQHLFAKHVVVQAAKSAGWSAEPEARGNGWVADVLASNGERKTAFEIQWSTQTRAEYERRQARYAGSGINGVWFARRERDVPYPRHDLPIFHMAFAENGLTVTVNQSTMTMADAVVALLNDRIGFREYVANGRPASLHVSCVDYPCYRCNKVSMIWDVDRETIQGPCGTTAEQHTGTIWAKIRPEAEPQILRRANIEAERIGLSSATLGQRYSRTAGGSYTAFSCPNCDALFGDWFLRSHMLEARTAGAQLDLMVPAGRDRISSPHWCVDTGSGLCANSAG
ncbi:hypothetical protein [Dactylosporangium maewongense]|uniref:competence protein CoiA family protein n=1 Tax=Dactylosporangium maewongense TaxID=634393 RepID=UPI0031DD65B6